MKIPNKIRITQKITYEIVYQDEIKSDPDCIGLCDPNTKHIYIKNGLSKTGRIKCLLHEICHAIFDENEIKINHSEIYKIEESLFKFLKLNKFI